MAELTIILLVLAAEAVLLAIGLLLWRLRRRRRPTPPGLIFPHELEQQARRHLQAELDKTRRAVEYGAQPASALRRRMEVLTNELAALELADRADEYWEFVGKAYDEAAQ